LMIAISYRREDSLPIAGRLYDRLQAKFGKENVFMDFDSIPPGVDFREQIKQTIERSNLVIVMIGPHWLGERGDGSRRIDDPTDFVRLEIEYALKASVRVIPLLINATPMPKAEKLPEDIQALAFRNALPLDSGLDFHQHVDRLIGSLSDGTGAIQLSSKLRASDGSPIATAIRARAKTRVTRMSVVAALVAAFIVVAIWVLTRQSSTRLTKTELPAEPMPALPPWPTVMPQASPEPSIPQFTESPRVAAAETPPSRSVVPEPTIVEKEAERFSGIWKGHLTTWKYENLAAQLSIDDSETVVILTFNRDEKAGWSHGRASNTLRDWSHDGPNVLTAHYDDAREGKISIALSGTGADATLMFHGGEELGEGTFRRAGKLNTAPSVNATPVPSTNPAATPKNKKPFAGTWQGRIHTQSKPPLPSSDETITIWIDANETGAHIENSREPELAKQLRREGREAPIKCAKSEDGRTLIFHNPQAHPAER
jgi:TIR domain